MTCPPRPTGPDDEPPTPPPSPEASDVLAVAVGNASLLGVGYLLMGRPVLFWAAAMVTVPLLWMTVSVAETWCELLLLLWWAAVVAHGWLLARRRQGGPRLGRRLLALGLTVPVLLAAGLLRLDAHGIEDDVTEAREGGDCEAVTSAQDRVRFGHRIAAAPVAARGDAVVDACERLGRAEHELTTGLNGDLGGLDSGFRLLASVLEDPGNEKTVRASLDRFLGRLPTENACDTVRITDWLRARKTGRNILDRSFDTASRLAPAALVGCGDDLADTQSWPQARARYERLLEEYPDDGHADRARKGIRKAVLALELEHVEELVRATNGMTSGYCAKPAKYTGAPARRKGTNRALFLGDDEYTGKLPGGWRTTDPEKAALVVCAGPPGFGSAIETCPYRNDETREIANVTFRKVEVPVKVYELRTGERLANRKVQIDGSSCPTLFLTYGGVPSDKYVTPSDADVRDAFSSVVGR